MILSCSSCGCAPKFARSGAVTEAGPLPVIVNLGTVLVVQPPECLDFVVLPPTVISPHRSFSVPFRSFRGQFFPFLGAESTSSKSHPDALKAGSRSFPSAVDPPYDPPPSDDTLMTSAREADFVHGRDGRARKGKTVSVCLHCAGCSSLPDDPFVFKLRVRAKVRRQWGRHAGRSPSGNCEPGHGACHVAH